MPTALLLGDQNWPTSPVPLSPEMYFAEWMTGLMTRRRPWPRGRGVSFQTPTESRTITSTTYETWASLTRRSSRSLCTSLDDWLFRLSMMPSAPSPIMNSYRVLLVRSATPSPSGGRLRNRKSVKGLARFVKRRSAHRYWVLNQRSGAFSREHDRKQRPRKQAINLRLRRVQGVIGPRSNDRNEPPDSGRLSDLASPLPFPSHCWPIERRREMSAITDLIDREVAAYRDRDLDAYLSHFAEDVVVT